MMAKLKGIVAVLAFCGVIVLGSALIAQQNSGGGPGQSMGGNPMNPTIRAMIQGRMEAAKQVYESSTNSQSKGPLDLDALPAWSRRWMDEQIHLDSAATTTLAAMQDHLDRLKALEAIAGRRHEAARGTQTDALKVKYFRLEAEQMLAELRIINPNLTPPPKPAARR